MQKHSYNFGYKFFKSRNLGDLLDFLKVCSTDDLKEFLNLSVSDSDSELHLQIQAGWDA